MGLRFQWDPRKEQANVQKHGVSFIEASTVFADTLSMTIPDPDHSIGESRYLILGMTRGLKLLVVAHTESDDMIRIISARPADRTERRRYEQGTL